MYHFLSFNQLTHYDLLALPGQHWTNGNLSSAIISSISNVNEYAKMFSWTDKICFENNRKIVLASRCLTTSTTTQTSLPFPGGQIHCFGSMGLNSVGGRINQTSANQKLSFLGRKGQLRPIRYLLIRVSGRMQQTARWTLH